MVWILETGLWNDDGVWDDTDVWVDGPTVPPLWCWSPGFWPRATGTTMAIGTTPMSGRTARPLLSRVSS